MTGCGVSNDVPRPQQDLDILQAGGTNPVKPARTSSSIRCKWRIVIRGSASSRQYYVAVSAMYTTKSEIYCWIDPAEAGFFCPSSFERDSSLESTNYS